MLDDFHSSYFIDGKNLNFNLFDKDNFYSKHSVIVRSDVF